MLEYEIQEAEEVLLKNHDAAKKSLGQVDEDLLFIRDQMTTLEVSILLRLLHCLLQNLFHLMKLFMV